METLRYVVLANGLLAIISIAFYALLRRETFFRANRLALWLGVAGAIILPVVEMPDWRPQPVRAVMHRTAQVIVPKVLPNTTLKQPDVVITFPNGRTYSALLNHRLEAAWSWQHILIALYILVVVILFFRFAIQVISLWRLIKRSAHEAYDHFTLVRNERVTSPFSFFGWVVLNPDQHEPDELEQILRHERVHVSEKHSLDMIGAELVCIIFWFNPAAYLFRNLLQQTLEFSADRAVLAEGVDSKSYQYNLLKVSLSAGQSTLLNHFSKSQLKSRIIMLNRPKSKRAMWLKYPVLLLAILTVSTLFAHSNPQGLTTKFIPASVSQTLVTVFDRESVVTKPAYSDLTTLTSSIKTEPILSERSLKSEKSIVDSGLKQDSRVISERTSPSRYMQYEGDRLYWIVTPKTSFDDLVIMKQEFERHGYKMHIQALKYDPLNLYITDIKVTIIRPVVGISDFEETAIEGKPIRSYGGFNGLNKLNNVAAVGSYPFNNDFLHLPQELIQTARQEELSVTKFIHDNRMNYLIETGKKISSGYGPSSTTVSTLSGIVSRPDLVEKYGIKLRPDSTLTILDSRLPVYVNNELVTHNVLKRINIKNFSTLMLSEEYGKNGQPRAINALLLYTKEP